MKIILFFQFFLYFLCLPLFPNLRARTIEAHELPNEAGGSLGSLLTVNVSETCEIAFVF